MNSRTLIPVALAAALLAEGCASSSAANRVPVAPIAAREAQTRFFENVDATTAMKAVIDMLQDGQFSIDRTDSTLGLVVGTRSTTKRASAGETALRWTTIAFTYGMSALLPWTKNETFQLEASANVTSVGDGSRVRVTVHRRVLDGKGMLKRIEPVDDPALYADLFELMGRSVFVADAR